MICFTFQAVIAAEPTNLDNKRSSMEILFKQPSWPRSKPVPACKRLFKLDADSALLTKIFDAFGPLGKFNGVISHVGDSLLVDQYTDGHLHIPLDDAEARWICRLNDADFDPGDVVMGVQMPVAGELLLECHFETLSVGGHQSPTIELAQKGHIGGGAVMMVSREQAHHWSTSVGLFKDIKAAFFKI